MLRTRFRLLLLTPLFLTMASIGWSQAGGNQIYRNSGYGNQSAGKAPVFDAQTITSTDSTLTIHTQILLNYEADHYMITAGVSQEGETVKMCNELINARIDAFKKDLAALNIGESSTYVDFISQTKIYDYESKGATAKQYSKGFEIKKNIIFKINDINLLDQLMVLMAKQDIYDLIKVEYVNKDLDAVYDQMYDEAVKVMKRRKKMFVQLGDINTVGGPRILGDFFASYAPKDHYQQYQAFETSNIRSNYNQDYFIKEARKHKTFYYDGIDPSRYDKHINATVPKVGLQYVLAMTVQFELERKN